MAQDTLENELLSGSAYKIFIDELHKHLDFASGMFDCDHLTKEAATTGAARFHTIKGGAGFFKLHDLAAVAGRLEEILTDTEDPSVHIQLLRDLLQDLNKLAAEIPLPILKEL